MGYKDVYIEEYSEFEDGRYIAIWFVSKPIGLRLSFYDTLTKSITDFLFDEWRRH